VTIVAAIVIEIVISARVTRATLRVRTDTRGVGVGIKTSKVRREFHLRPSEKF